MPQLQQNRLGRSGQQSAADGAASQEHGGRARVAIYGHKATQYRQLMAWGLYASAVVGFQLRRDRCEETAKRLMSDRNAAESSRSPATADALAGAVMKTQPTKKPTGRPTPVGGGWGTATAGGMELTPGLVETRQVVEQRAMVLRAVAQTANPFSGNSKSGAGLGANPAGSKTRRTPAKPATPRRRSFGPERSCARRIAAERARDFRG